MNGKRTLSIVTALILVIAVLAGTAGQAMAQGPQTANKGGRSDRLDFTATLHGGAAEKFVLGPSDRNGGYVVDVTPLVDWRMVPTSRSRSCPSSTGRSGWICSP